MKKMKRETSKKAVREKNRQKRFYQFCLAQARQAGRKIRMFENAPLTDLIKTVAEHYGRTETDTEAILKACFDKRETLLAWDNANVLDAFEML